MHLNYPLTHHLPWSIDQWPPTVLWLGAAFQSRQLLGAAMVNKTAAN